MMREHLTRIGACDTSPPTNQINDATPESPPPLTAQPTQTIVDHNDEDTPPLTAQPTQSAMDH
eukprot:10295734-Heterocapsa_arctica.AAC.1